MSESLSDAVREAARQGAEELHPNSVSEVYSRQFITYRHEMREGFEAGAVWVAGRLPSRDEIGAVVFETFHAPDEAHTSWWINPGEMADAVLALIRGHITKEENDNT